MKGLETFWMNIWKNKAMAVVFYLLGRGGDSPVDGASGLIQNLLSVVGAG